MSVRKQRTPLHSLEYIEKHLPELRNQRDELVKHRRLEQKKESLLQGKKVVLPQSQEEVLIRKEINTLQMAKTRRKKSLLATTAAPIGAFGEKKD